MKAEERAAPSIAASSLIDTAGQLAVLFLSLIGGVVLSRLLGAEGRGQYVYATYVVSALLLGLGNMGAGVAAQAFCARDRSRLGELHTLGAGICALAGWGLGGACLLAFPYLSGRVLKDVAFANLLVVSIGLPFQMYLALAYGLLVGMGEVRPRALFEVCYQGTQSVAVVLILLAGRRLGVGEPVAALVVAYFSIMAVASLPLAWLLSRNGAIWKRPASGLARDFLRYGRDIWIGGIANEVAWRIDQLLVNQHLGAAQLGIYNLATSNSARSALAAVALTRSLYARVCALPSSEAAELCARGFRQLVLVGVAMLAAGACVIPLFPVLYGKEFAEAGPLFFVVLLGWVPHNASRMLSMYFTGHLVRADVPMKVNWLLLPFQVGVTWTLVRSNGMWGAAIATALSYAAVAGTFVFLFARRPETPTLGELLVPRREDARDWIDLGKRVLRRG